MFGIGASRNKKRVLAILDRFASRLSPSEIAEARELVLKHEQPETALDLITCWLYQHQQEISQEDLGQIQITCEKLQLPDSSWEMLGAIVRDRTQD